MPRLPISFLTALSALLSVVGCANYQLGTDSPLSFTTLNVAPVKMVALLPQAEPIISKQLRTAFLQDGRVSLQNYRDGSDVTLAVTVLDYRREVATVRQGDTGLARKFIITLTAEASLTDNRSGKPLFSERKIVVKRDVYTDSGQQQAEYQILPLLAEDLAVKASHAVLDTW